MVHYLPGVFPPGSDGHRTTPPDHPQSLVNYYNFALSRTRYGRHVMTVTAAIGALGLYTVLISLWPTGIVAAILRAIRTGLLLLLAVMMIQRTRMFIDAQHRRPRDDEPE